MLHIPSESRERGFVHAIGRSAAIASEKASCGSLPYRRCAFPYFRVGAPTPGIYHLRLGSPVVGPYFRRQFSERKAPEIATRA